MFCFKLAPDLSGGADAWCGAWTFETGEMEKMPKGYLPTEGILPVLSRDESVQNIGFRIQMIATKHSAG